MFTDIQTDRQTETERRTDGQGDYYRVPAFQAGLDGFSQGYLQNFYLWKYSGYVYGASMKTQALHEMYNYWKINVPDTKKDVSGSVGDSYTAR